MELHELLERVDAPDDLVVWARDAALEFDAVWATLTRGDHRLWVAACGGTPIEVLVEELACRWGLKPDKLWDVEVPPGVLEGGLTIAKALSATRAEWLRQKQLAEQAASRRLYLASRQLYQYNCRRAGVRMITASIGHRRCAQLRGSRRVQSTRRES